MSKKADLEQRLEGFLDGLVAVHLTDYKPEGGLIKTTSSARGVEVGKAPRHTVHFALNHAVSSFGMGNDWDDKRYAVIVPLKDLMSQGGNQLANIYPVDTFFAGDVRIPKEQRCVIEADGKVPVGEVVKDRLRELGVDVYEGNMWDWNGKNSGQPSEEDTELLRDLSKAMGIEYGPHNETVYDELEAHCWPLYNPESFDNRWGRDAGENNGAEASQHILRELIIKDFDRQPATPEMYKDAISALALLDSWIDKKRTAEYQRAQEPRHNETIEPAGLLD